MQGETTRGGMRSVCYQVVESIWLILEWTLQDKGEALIALNSAKGLQTVAQLAAAVVAGGYGIISRFWGTWTNAQS